MNTQNEREISPIEEMTRIARSILNIEQWGFKESYRSAGSGNLIFDSDWCRINFIWGGWDYGGGNSINLRYGRLHAPNEEATMTWNGEKCRCWHRFEHALHFLDGRSPADTAKLDYSHPITSPFYSEEIRNRYPRRQPEWLAHMHATVWQQYGTQLFELFDLRRPQLWHSYRQFLIEVYDIAGRIPTIKPSWDKVC
jgi:hypothetical protein